MGDERDKNAQVLMSEFAELRKRLRSSCEVQRFLVEIGKRLFVVALELGCPPSSLISTASDSWIRAVHKPIARRVAKELGHGGDSMVKRVYGHLGAVRHRSDVVEFRIEQHQDKLQARLGSLRRC